MAPSALLLFLQQSAAETPPREPILCGKKIVDSRHEIYSASSEPKFPISKPGGTKVPFFQRLSGCKKGKETSERGGGATTGLPGSETGTEDEGVARIDGIRHKFRT